MSPPELRLSYISSAGTFSQPGEFPLLNTDIAHSTSNLNGSSLYSLFSATFA